MARRSLKYNTAVLTVTGFLVKVIGFFYRIFIANSIGTEGLGLYQLIIPIYSLVVLVLSAGISISVSRFVAEETSGGGTGSGIRITSVSAGIILLIGGVVSGILILNADAMLLWFVKDPRAKDSLLWMLYLIPPIAAASAYKGYFYGKQRMMPNAIGQITEQIVKLVFVLALYPSFKGRGVESMCLLASLGMLAGECANVLFVFLAFQFEKFRNRDAYDNRGSSRVFLGKLGRTAVPISANRLIISVIGTAESLIIPQRLILYGLTYQQSLMAFGRLTGMAAPLVFFPSMLPMALATALVPAIASAVASRRYSAANRQISQSIRLTIIMGLIFTSFYATCSHELAELIFPGKEAGDILYILSFTGVFLYLQQTMLGILNGLSRESAILLNTIAGSAIRLALIWFCLPVWGVEAYIIGVIAGSLIAIILNFRDIAKITGMSINIGEWFIKPTAAALAGSILAMALKRMPALLKLGGRMSLALATAVALAVILSAFAVSGIIKREDIKRWAGRSSVILFDFL
jgi:stage V sporulation protein B